MATIKRFYASSPVFFQNFLVSLQGFLHNHRRVDINRCRLDLGFLRTSQYWDSGRFLAYQIENIRSHLMFAAQSIPYYRRLFKRNGINPLKIDTLEDFKKIPILVKKEVVNTPSEFLRNGKADRKWNHLFTSGTTGSPLDLWSSRESFSRIWSFVYRIRDWAGLSDPFYPRRVQFTGREIVPGANISKDRIFWRHNLPGNALLMSTTHICSKTAPYYIEAVNRFRPELIDGYPSAIALIAGFAGLQRISLHRPKAIITSAETLLDSDRDMMQKSFGCPVFNQYASSDTAAFISSCEYGGLHIHPEFGICEILNKNGDSSSGEEEGEIVATSFCNKEQVFIRYKTGDTAIPINSACKCGRQMPMVQSVTGRLDDILYFPERGYIGRLDPVFKGLANIMEAQIIQESLNNVKVLLVPSGNFGESDKRDLIANLRQKIGFNTQIIIEITNHIPRGPNGKFRSVISKCRESYPEFATSSSSESKSHEFRD